MSQLMKTMSFSGATIEVLSIEDTIRQWNGGVFQKDNVMLLWGNVKDAYTTYQAGLKFAFLNLGNLPGGPGRVRVDKSNYIDATDAELLKKLASEHVDVYFQNMPNLEKTTLQQALKITNF